MDERDREPVAQAEGTSRGPQDKAELVPDAREAGLLAARGEWVLDNIEQLNARVESLASQASRLDASGITRLDASGALLLERLFCRTGQAAGEAGLTGQWRTLFEAVDAACDDARAPEPTHEPQWRQILARIGRAVVEVLHSSRELLGFLGITVDLKAREESGATVLHIAAGRGYASIVKRLLEAGAERLAADGEGRTPADVARLQGHQEAEALLRG